MYLIVSNCISWPLLALVWQERFQGEMTSSLWCYLAAVMEKAMAPHSSTLAWKIPWTEEPGRLQSMGSLRVEHDWATSLDFSLSCIGEGNGNPLQCSCLENPRDGGAWWAAVYGVAQSQTWLTRLSSSSRSIFSGRRGKSFPHPGASIENINKIEGIHVSNCISWPLLALVP